MKRLLYVLIPLVLIGAFVWKINTDKNTPNPTPTVNKTVTNLVFLSIDYGNGQRNSYQANLTENLTALDLLTNTTKENNIVLTVKKYDFGTLVESINNTKNNSTKAWIYFVNDQSPSVGADKYILKAGDKVEWRYIKPSF